MSDLQRRTWENPAADAAGLILRIGFAILVLAAPFAALFSRRAFVVLVPVGALLIVIAAFIRDARFYLAKARAALISPSGLVLLALVVWIVMSLAWTPFPNTAAERAFRTIGNAAMAAAVCVALPDRMRSSNLNLMSLGIALATVALMTGALFGSGALGVFTISEPAIFSRAAIAASVLVWPALAWTVTRDRDIEGILLIAACAIAAIASGSIAAAIVLFTALLVFLAVRVNPASAGRFLAWFWGGVILAAPALPFLARTIAGNMELSAEHLLRQIALWADVVAAQPVRLITGHGFDVINRARAAGLVDANAPSGLLAEVWYDLGLAGALCLAGAVVLGIRALVRAPSHIAAASLALISAIIVFMIIDPTATQQWWLSICVVCAITMTAVHHGQYRTRRPSVTMAQRRLIVGGG